MKKFFIILVLAFAVNSAAIAQVATPSASHRKAAEELMDIMDVSDAMFDSMGQMIKKQFAAGGMEDCLDEAKFMSAIKQAVDYENLKPKLVEIYMKHFSESEINDAVTFYKTPSGRKFIDKMPALMMEVSEAQNASMAGKMGELQGMMMESMQECMKDPEVMKNMQKMYEGGGAQ